MDCGEYRRLLLSDPARPDTTTLKHLANCADCTAYTDEVMRFEGRLVRALKVTVGTAAVSPIGWSAGPRGRRGAARRQRAVAIIASAMVVCVVGGFLWLAAPGRTLAAAVVDHMAEEPQAWVRTDGVVPAADLNAVMREAGVSLRSGAARVSYANSCGFRGHQVPHLVVQTAAGPVTVMVLAHEPLRSSSRFDAQGYRGVIVPIEGHGSLAVLERTGEDAQKVVDAVAAEVAGALLWRR